ncbi:sialate O-acetylesterase [Aplochiton taeniatus]
MDVTVNLHKLAFLISLLGCYCASDTKFRFASYYGDHMVLQKAPERAVLWGYGPVAGKVTVTLSGSGFNKTETTVVTEENHKLTKSPFLDTGIWRVTLDPVAAGGPYQLTASLPNNINTITFKDVLFGDVWLCGGQSNMQFTTSQIFNASKELALAAKYPNVRIFMAALVKSETELPDLGGVTVPWSVPTSKLLGDGNFTSYSAVCWLFGRYLYKTLNYPIGLVESCWGGTPVESWSSPRALASCGLNENSVLWNAMIHPLLNMTLKGAIWYQGEANTEYHQEQYSCAFPAMIDDWRMAFHQSSGGQTAADFPFGFVQLCTYIKGSKSEDFPNIRWHQSADYGFAPNPRMKKTFMAVALDLPDEKSPFGSIHPRDKQHVAYRLALGARAVAYGETDLVFQGPFPSKVVAKKGYLSITYDQKISVAASKNIFEVCCSAVKTLCGPKAQWVPAPIEQWDANTVQLNVTSCSAMDNVAGLRYAWRDWPCDYKACPIYSSHRFLPAPPFKLNISTEP